MNSVRTTIDDLGGFGSTEELRARGITPQALTADVRSGAISRVRKGIYTTRSPVDPERQALRVGGRLTGLSALELRQCWIWRRPTRIHVAVPHNASRLPEHDSLHLHWERRTLGDGDRTCVSVRDALIRVILDEPVENAVPCIDWALHTGRLGEFDFEEMLLELPQASRSIRGWVDRRSESVLESATRVRCIQRGWKFRPQARFGDLEAIDLLIEDIVALELDGREFHAATFDADRLRDLRVTIEGRHSIRLSYSIVRDHWGLVDKAITAALAARRHGDTGISGQPGQRPRGRHRSSGRRGNLA